MAAHLRGEVWHADLDPTRGHEQGGSRPVLAVSISGFNEGSSGLVSVVPITSRNRRLLMHVRIAPPEGGLKSESFAMCENLRSASLERLGRRWGSVSSETMARVERRLRILLGL